VSENLKQRHEERSAANRAQLDDEWRICTICGFKIKKSQAIAQKLKNCPRCGHGRVAGSTLPFDFRPDM
jgi:rubrerythrin